VGGVVKTACELTLLAWLTHSLHFIQVELSMDKMAETVGLLLAELPSHKDSVRVLLNQELPPAIRPQVWVENLREPKARKVLPNSCPCS